MKITVLGAGAWGTALAISLVGQHQVTLWARDPEQIDAMQKSLRNQFYLPDIHLPEKLALTDDFAVAINHAELVIVATPISALRMILQEISLTATHNIGLLWLCKGFEAETSLLPHQLAARILPEDFRYGVLSGPSFALEVAQRKPTALTLASRNEIFARHMAQALHHSLLRIYTSTDIVGVEIGGAVKNVMAIAAGICDGLGLGNNARAALISRGLVEITRLGLKMGGSAETLGGLSGAGDLILTCTGNLSRNRQVGLLLAERHDLQEILKQLGHVAEGVYAARELHLLAREHDISMPISDAVYRILYEHVPAADAVQDLLNRDPY